MSSNSYSTTVLPIQYLRGVAALMVVWHHTKTQISTYESLLPGNFGASGVDIFFVISGFIMLITTSRKSMNPFEFMIRRLIRIAPLYWILTIFMVLIWNFIPSVFKTLIVTPTSLLKSIFFLPSFSDSFPGNIFPLLVPGWTLNYEIFFYLLFAFSLFFKPIIGLSLLTVTIFLLVLVGATLGPFDDATLLFCTNPILIEFILGVFIAKCWLIRKSRGCKTVKKLLFVVGWILMIGNAQLDLDKYITIAGAALVVFGSLHVEYFHLVHKRLKIIGDATYSIYLTHIFTLGAFRYIWLHSFGNEGHIFNAAIFSAMSMTLCVYIGMYTHKIIELPLTRFLNSRYSSVTQGKAFHNS